MRSSPAWTRYAPTFKELLLPFARLIALLGLQGAHMYFCGLKGMMPGITDMLQDVSKQKGLVWEDKLKEWKENGQWHVEVY